MGRQGPAKLNFSRYIEDMQNKLETTLFAAIVSAMVYFMYWCVREMRRVPVHKELTPEELQEEWERQQTEAVNNEMSKWEDDDD